MFAIITPALIVGAIAERMKFSAILLFVTLWMFVVYFPLAHMVWGVDGLMNGVLECRRQDQSDRFRRRHGGAHVLRLVGADPVPDPRQTPGFGKEPMPPHSMVLCMVGTGMLWVGWYGFNAGSAVAADVIAANAFTTTTLATAVASFVWPMAEYDARGKPSVLGFCSGAVAGLVVITPACGFVTATGAVIIGIAAGLVPFFFCLKVKGWFGYDDALDTFGVHAVGGTMGAFLTGLLATQCRKRQLGARNLKDFVKDTVFQPLGARTAQGHRADAGAGSRRHDRHRLHRQSGHRPAVRPRRSKPPAWIWPNTARKATTLTHDSIAVARVSALPQSDRSPAARHRPATNAKRNNRKQQNHLNEHTQERN